MNNKWKVCDTAAFCFTASLSTGCQSLPWGGTLVNTDDPIAPTPAHHGDLAMS